MRSKDEASASKPLSVPGKKKKSKISGQPHKSPGALPAEPSGKMIRQNENR